MKKALDKEADYNANGKNTNYEENRRPIVTGRANIFDAMAELES